MLTKKQIQEIRDYLNKSENPLIFYDNDPDGVCSYILMKKYLPTAKGIPIKSTPELNTEYSRKIDEHQPDLVIILDKPIVSQDFIDNIKVPIVWIDHHPLVKRRKVKYYNPLQNDPKDNRPVSYLCYKITEKNLWQAMVGTVSDWHMPDFTNEFMKIYPKLLKKKCKPGDAIFNSKLGELIRMFEFAIKGTTTDTKKSVEVLAKIESPDELLNKTTPRGKYIHKKTEKLTQEYKDLLKKAVKEYDKKDPFLTFFYTTQSTSFTNELSNELLYKYPEKLTIVGRKTPQGIKMSLRSDKINIPPLLEKALVNIKGYGGGHKNACGSKVAKDDLERFLQNMRCELDGS